MICILVLLEHQQRRMGGGGGGGGGGQGVGDIERALHTRKCMGKLVLSAHVYMYARFKLLVLDTHRCAASSLSLFPCLLGYKHS